MLDISDKLGRTVCSELQKEFAPDDVTFIHTDVTKTEQLVKIEFAPKPMFQVLGKASLFPIITCALVKNPSPVLQIRM